MKRFVGFLSLMVLLLNSVLMPLTYAQEYQDEILGAQVNNTVGDSSNVENANETEGEQNEEADDASQFPVIEENPQESEITPVDEPQDEDQEISSESTLSGGLEGSENTNQEGANGVGSGNDLDETLGSGAEENLNVQTGADQIDDTLSGALVSEQLDSSGDVVSLDVGSGNIEDLDEDSGILSSVVEAIEGIFNSIRYFFVKDNSEYIREYKQNGVKVISLKDPVNGETITIMDRNLGAEDNEITSEDSYGNYYQWGNNNGFEKVDGGNATSNLAVYSLKYEGIGYTRDNKFRVGSNDIWELDEEGRSNYDELWYLGEDEEIQGPCPEGYHIPSDKEWNKLVRVWTKIHTVDEKEGGKTVRSVKGDSLKASLEQAGTGDAEENTIEEENLTEVAELFMKELKLPKAGNYATNGEREDGLGIYWTRTPSDKLYQSKVFSIEKYFGEDFDDELLNRANGNSLRCFLDTYEKEVVEYNKEEITGEETFDDVTVSVYAGTGFFPEGTKLLISPIIQEQEIDDIKDKISEEDDNIIEDSKLVAFDISFIYRGEEVQPLEGKVVKVTFDYSNNDELLEADKIDEQGVKVFHIDDKDEEGNKVESGEEVVKDVTNIIESEESGIAVADAESFSVYAVVVTSGNGLEVTYNLNGGYWIEDHTTNPKTVIYTNKEANMLYRTPSNTGFMFMGWFDESLTTRRDGNVTNGMNVYAKWQEFGDLDIYIIKNESTRTHYTFMDRNMGATEIYNKIYCNIKGESANCTSQRNNYASYGYYYQWGNNYGFDSYAVVPGALSNQTGKGQKDVSSYSRNRPYSSPIFRGTDVQDWVKGTYTNLWGGTESDISHRQGPCPDGYHIPTKAKREEIANNWTSGNNRDILHSLHKDFLLPAASYRKRGDRTIDTNAFHHYRYLASTYDWVFGDENNDNLTRNLVTLSEKISNGYSVRCLKNETNTNSTVFDINNIDLRGGEKAIISILSSGEVVSLQNPVRNIDDEFRGWYTTSDYSGNPIGIGSGLFQGDHLYAKWCADGLVDDGSQCINAYTITFDTDGGTSVSAQIVVPGETGTIPAAPTKDGYSFVGWYLTGLQTEFDFDTPIISNIILYAKWTPIEYTIDYILNSGFVLETNPTYYTIESGDFTLNNPIRVGYDFIGWSGTNLPECSVENHSICSEIVSIIQGSTGNRVYEAIFDVEKHALSFDSLGGSVVTSQRVVYGENGTRPENPTKDGYSFVGWYYTGLEIEFNFNTPITSDITLYAKWTPIEYTINYNLNSGSVSQINPTTYTIESSDITLNNPTREWYIFEGWSGTNLPACSMEDTSTCNKTVTISRGSIGNRTYEAIWGYVKHDLIFDSLGGSEVEIQKIIHGKTGTKPVDPTRDGYTFVGWYYTGLQTEFNFTGTIINSDITVYAKWNLIDYTITYNLNGGTGLVNTGIYTVETETFTLNNPIKLNYDFIGWSGTNLSLCSVDNQTTCNKVVTIEQGSTGDRVYEAIYDCAYGKKLDGTCNIVRGEDGLIDYTNWEYNDLEVDLGVTESVRIILMDRNLGAAISGVNGSDSYGFYYQWGNNYGFKDAGNISTEQVDASAYGPTNYYVSDTFIQQNTLGWDAPSNYNLWGGTGDTETKRGNGSDGDRQGPCPVGYHVPSILEWRSLNSFADDWRKSENATDVCSEYNDNRECVLSKILKLPRAGNLQSNTQFEGVGVFGRYWSSSRYNDDRSYRYKVNANWDMSQGTEITSSNYYNPNGMSVRCFKNVSSKPIVYELSGGVQTSNQTSTVVWWNASAKKTLTIPTKTGFVFGGWYLTSGYEEGTRVTTNLISDYSDNATVTLYAKWRDTREVKVTYDVNGGYFPGDNDKTKERVYGESEASSGYYIIGTTDWKTPSKAGYMFGGWYLTGLTTRWTGYLENDITVYAKWLPFEDYDVKLSDDITITIMDRNLGAESSGIGCSSSDLSTCGYHFQWGNNYGFAHSGNGNLFPNGETYSSVQATDWSDSISTYFKSVWIARVQWYTPMGLTDNLWGGVDAANTDDNVRQGPCPDGYHVPTTNEWKKIGNITSISSGSELRDILKLPYAGSRSDTAYTVGNLGSYGRYQSSTPSRHGNAGIFSSSILAFSDDSLNWSISSLTNRGAGLSVRCFKNTEKRALSFETKGGSEIASTQTVRWWETISNLPSPTRSNSTFSGWYMTPGYEEGTKVSTNYIGTGSGPVTLYAKWECKEGYVEADNGNACVEKTYTVTITSNNEDYGSVTSGSVVAQDGAAITTSGNELTIGDVTVLARVKLSTPQYTYLFSGWNNTCGDELSSDCSIVAEFTRNTNSYTITFHSNGGSSVEEQTKEYGQTGDEPEDPTRDGYDFIGWYSDSGLTNEYHFTEEIEGNVDLYAKWTPIEYSINYILNEGSVSESNPETYTIESADIILNNPTKTGYTFIGWSGTKLEGAENKTVTIGVGSTGDRKYEANWNANKYQVTYKANGGVGSDVVEEVTYDEHYEFLSNSFEKTGYRFVEWNTKSDGTGTGYAEGFSGTWETTTGANLYAIWNENSYNVAYAGGDGAIGTKVGFTTNYTDLFVLVDNEGSFIKTGYSFSGWSYDGKHYTAGTELSRLATENGATVTFTAEWNKETYTISYEYNNGTGSNPETYQVDTPSFTLNNPTRTGYTFIGWSGTELEGLDNTNVTIVIGSVGDREYEANWEANNYNVTYKANGGAGADVIEQATYDVKYVFTGNKFTKTGYRFVEWNTKSDGTGTGYTEGFSGIWKTTTGVNLYAQWTAETYIVTFDGNEGEVVGDNTKEVSYDGEYGELPTATRLGYTFIGWYTEDTAGDKVEGETRVATANDHTLYAHWDENSYNVVYEGGIGSEGVVTGATYRYTESFNLAANNFTKRGYSFSGWKNGDNHYAAGAELSRLAAQNGATVTFTAEWNVVPYSITYELNGGIFSGIVNPTTYDVNSSTINVGNPERVGYIFLGWTGTDLSALSSNVVITGGSIGDRTYYANWQARDDIKITINHYLQDLDVDNNTVLDTYSISGTVKEEGTADSTINVSDYKQTIEGYSFDSGKVDGSVVSTTTVSPDGSRVIDLFYTRNSYSYAITTSVGSSTEGSSSNGNYYYGAKIILSGDSNNDCFVWSGWAVQGATLENNMKQTSFIMPANDVTANSLVREKVYNIVFNGNGEDSGTMSPLNGIRCTQEFTLPENSFVKTGYTFTGWTTIPNGVKEFDNKATIQTLTTGDNVTIEFIAIWDVNYYPIVWKDYDGDVLYEDEFPYMGNPEYHGETPSRDADEQYTYTFAGWTPEEHVVTGSQVYTAVYKETLNEYTVTWDVNGTKTMETYKYGETPNFTGSKHKDPDEQYEYSFAGWTPEISSVTGDITYTATYTATLRKFTVTWNNRNGQTLEVDTGVEYGTVPHYGGETPTKPSDAGHTYTFNGWTPELTGVTKDTIYVAKFSSDDNKYTITWLDEDDTILEIDTDVPYGTIPSYGKGTPVKTGDAQYSYTFSGWSPKVIPVEGDATYVATYTSEVNTYTITWKNSNGETLREDTGVAYGTTGDFGGIPTSGSTDEFDYEFIGWNPAVGAIHGDTTYTAVYKSNKRKYSVRFVNGETELQSGMVEYGVMPVYIGSTPVKTGDAQYSYNYIGWTPGISAVTGDITYEATFEEIVNMYNVIFVDDDGSSVIQPAQKYAYGTLRGNIAKPVNPDKPDNEQYTYEFAGWIPVVSKITGDVIFTATYSGTLRTYSVTWKNWNGDVLETDANVPYGETPSYDSAEPTKPATAQYRYEFKGWDPVVSPVHGIIIYTAQFDEVSMTYTITWKNGDTVLEVDTGVVYGSIPSYDGVIPTKASDSQYDYVFVGWNPSTGEVVGDQVYVADFDPIIRTYTVLWKNHDGTTLETDENVPYGSTPSYNGSTPVKTGNAQYSYTFKDWSPDIGPIHGNTEYTAIYNETINKYVVAWDNYDGTELISDEVEYGVLPQYTGPTPTRERTDKYSYTFSNSWFPTVTSVTTGATYTAQFTSTVNEYTITWKDGDGNTLKTEQVAYDETPEYTGATPTKTATAQYTYSFNNTWSPEVQSVTGDMTYTAQFDSTVNEYSVTWVDGDGVTLKTDQVAYGETPEYTGETPTKTPTAQHTYTFKGWSPAIKAVDGDITYTAVFDGDTNEYTITWLDGDGNTLKTETLEYGQTPAYDGATPTKTSTDKYTYTFNGTWSPAIQTVSANATYTAQFDSTVNKYTVTWKDGDGDTLKTEQVAYDETPVYVGDTPTKTATAQYTYTFNNTWSPAVQPVTGNITYIAQFNSGLNYYTITWKDGDDKTLYAESLAYGTTLTYAGATPTKTATVQYSYTFNNTWSPEIEDVTTGATYTAQFTPVLNKYTIVWKDWNGTILKPAEELEYGTYPTYGAEDPTREGDAHYSYTFNGWNPTVQNVTGPQTYTATYLQTVNKYQITFLNDDDSVLVSKQVEYGTTASNYKPADPVKEGYSFNGWNPGLVTVVTGATYKATYTINQYTLTPELGVGLERIEGGGTFDYGTEVVFTGYAKEGYHFEGGETVKVFTVTVGAHNATVRINAIANKYVVRFQPNEGDGTMQDQEFAYDLTGVLHANSFRRSGYTFTGWIDEFGNYYADQGKVYNLATGGVVEFTALWKVGEDKPVEPTPAAGGGRIIPKEDKDQEHGSADTQTGGTGDIDSGSQYETGDIIPGDGSWTQEEMDAYKYAYKYHITTLAPREAAMPDDYVIRGHMAKMVVNYAVNVLGWKLPEKLPKQCKWKDGANDWESQEIKDYAEKACALGLMGIDMNYFQPNKYVTRAQFGTIFGRLLRGKLPSTPYYAAHLAGLKERGIMTQIDHPEDRIEIRKWAWLMFMRSEKYFNIKK